MSIFSVVANMWYWIFISFSMHIMYISWSCRIWNSLYFEAFPVILWISVWFYGIRNIQYILAYPVIVWIICTIVLYFGLCCHNILCISWLSGTWETLFLPSCAVIYYISVGFRWIVWVLVNIDPCILIDLFGRRMFIC